MNTQEFAELIKHLATITKAERFIEKIEAVLCTSASIDMEKSVQEIFSEEEYELIQKIKLDDQGWRECLQSILRELNRVPVLQITVAIQPSWLYQQTLAQKLQNTIQENFLIKIVEQETIIAGAIIDFKGKRTDLSIQTKLQKYT